MQKIWFKEWSLQELAVSFQTNMMAHLDIRLEELQDAALVGSMPVDHRTMQPFGLLHGGASCTLAESLGSIASNLALNPETHFSVGQSITTYHLRSLRSGRVYGRARPLHLGRTSHVWEIDMFSSPELLEKDRCSKSTLTTAILEKRT